MKYYFITGTSKGIGMALAEELLLESDAKVIGISRKQTISHKQYQHVAIDLSQTEELLARLPEIFREINDATTLVLINNAGVLGEIGYVGTKENVDFGYIFKVNVTAPAILMNAFLKQYSTLQSRKIILNISSGAGKYPMDGWASYCASKAALDLFSQTVQEEQNLLKGGVKVFAVSPGVVDTGMQAQIRQTDSGHFSQVHKFREYKTNGTLAPVKTVAQKLIKVLAEEENNSGNKPVVFRLE